jgi:hypothetical protein
MAREYMKVKIARIDLGLLDQTSIGPVEVFVIPDGDPVVVETMNVERFNRWLKALRDAKRKFEVLPY